MIPRIWIFLLLGLTYGLGPPKKSHSDENGPRAAPFTREPNTGPQVVLDRNSGVGSTIQGDVESFVSLSGSDSAPGPNRFQRSPMEPFLSVPKTSQLMQSRAVDTRITLQIKEGQPPYTLVGKIPTKPGFTYRFNENPKDFLLNSTNGEIRTNTVLDRESLKNDRYDLVILSSQPTYPIEVRILVLDVNDNYPEFPEQSIAVSFSESASAGTRLLLDAAFDRDIGVNGISDDYQIVDGNKENKFRLVVTANPTGQTSYLHLETTGKLDRETQGFYTLNISARDGGVPPKHGFLQVNVTILDVNDNPPIFDHSDYTSSLNESVPPGTQVLQVMATDNDVGDNAKITYYLAETERQFSVDPVTGQIFTTEFLDCQSNCNQQTYCPDRTCPEPITKCPKSCVFTVFARDHGTPRQDGRTYVTVNLLDSNDHEPIIRFRYFPASANHATVDENAQNGSVVAAVSVFDQDEGLNGETTLKIISGNDLNHFRLDYTPNFDIVRVNGVLDREEIPKYNLTVVASDKGSPPRTATAFLIIYVNDINDHEPVFEKTEYSAVLSELSPTGSYVAGISAFDEDTGVNSEIHYSIVSGNDQNWFSINPETGLVVTKAPLDRELQGTIDLKISARDGGPNPKWAYTQLKITILDENDSKPSFSQELINVSIAENNPIDSPVAMVKAFDPDQGTNGSITYSLHPEIEVKYPKTFDLDPVTGQLTLKTQLDREKIDSYLLRIIAKDQGSPQMSSTSVINLKVLDLNDNVPTFYPSEYFKVVPENSQPGQTLLQVFANDPDDQEKVTYKLEEGGEDIFQVDSKTGVIILKRSLKNTQRKYFTLRISARDKENQKAQKEASIEIFKEGYVEEVKFEDFFFEVIEDFGGRSPKLGRKVGEVKIPGIGTPLKFSIGFGDPNQNFKIDETTGVISTAKAIDREQNLTYSLQVLARSSSRSLIGTTTVNISVLDLNDNPPVFVRDGKDEIILPENSAVGQEIHLARARDPDSGVNSKITYSLTQNPGNQFRISTSGVIYLNRPIRLDPGTILGIEVLATDSGTPALSTRNHLKVFVEDVNDHTPVFDHTSYETSLLESTKVNERFFALGASDADLGENGSITYEISDGNFEGKFDIFPDGYLYVRKPLDREEKNYYSLTVTVKDLGKPPRWSQVPVIIHVIDINDNPPRFTNNTFIFSIKENEPPDSFVGKLQAVDKDIGRNAELIFSLPANQVDFVIDPRNGFIKTLRAFDREELVRSTGSNVISLEAVVTDNGVPRLKDKVKVEVFITDVNDNPPKFIRSPERVQISEGSLLGTQVFRVYTHDLDQGLNGDVFYKISAGNDDETFEIDESTGGVNLAKILDREKVEKYQLQIVAYDAGEVPLSSSTTVVVEILDENDVTPVFGDVPKRIEVVETTPVGEKLVQFKASDSDLGINAEITYSITSGNRRDTFHIDPTSGWLYLHKPLDFEEIWHYQLNITASDSGTPKLSSTMRFDVDLLDSNDNLPVFPNTAIVRQIREGIAPQTPIVTITAEDPDSNLNGKVTYSIKNQEPENSKRFFGIDPISGVIHTLLEIDREEVDTFRLTVVATDMGHPVQSAEKLVTVIVEDVNDCAPYFVSMNSAPLEVSKMENFQGHPELMTLEALDLDSSTNGLVTYEIINGNLDLFQINRNTGVLSLKRTIRTPQNKYQIAVKATDEAVQTERKSTDAYITILASNLTSEGPQFDLPSYTTTVFENEPIGTSILTISARFGSEPVEYYVTNVTGVNVTNVTDLTAVKTVNSKSSNKKKVHRLFEIDTKLGVLSTAAILDRESGIQTYEVTIYAIVPKGPIRTSKTKVTVTILDKNDSPPSFKNSELEFSVSEDLAENSPIGTLKAEDPDTIGRLEYTIISGDDGHFDLDKFSGQLKLRESLDRETKDSYQLVVRCSDGIQSSDTIVTIKVTDTNDNPPIFGDSAYSFDIPENAVRGHKVGQITATDPDEGQNSQLTYTVISDWANDVFSLNPHTGVFTLTARLDYEEVQHYILVVQAVDSGTPALSSTLTVYCNVIDLNDNSPIFDPMSYTNEIFENVSIHTPVVTVSATDLDSGDNGRIKYNIISGDKNGDFEIASNGTILTKKELDRETQSLYNLVVMATDEALPPNKQLSSTVQVTIVLKDVNDQSPEFITPNETSVYENIPINTVVMAIKAIDKDEGRNGYIEYNLQPDPEYSSIFSLGPVDGLLRVNGRIDREQKNNFTLLVTAKDRGEIPKQTQTKIFVKILDENDNNPIFDPKLYSASVAENASIGASVLQVSATDIDDSLNGRIRYSIISGDRNRDFSISEDTGIIRVAKNLNFERKSRYLLKVRAEDCSDILGQDTRFDICQVSIQVTDINDNMPTFLDSPYLAYVMENVIPPNGGYILTVTAHDADHGPFNNLVRYFIKEGDTDIFKINASSGDISLLRALDREIQEEYTLSLVAMDTGSPPLTGTGTVKIIIQDVNDHSPEFDRQFYRASISENSPVGSWVLTPVAVDKDSGLNAKIRYSLLGDKVDRFVIDPDSGVIMTGVTLDREETPFYYLTLIAQDLSTTDPRATAVNLTIDILDENDNSPHFSSQNYEVYIPNNTKKNQFVFGAKAIDIDLGKNSKIIYSLRGQNAPNFTIDPTTGVIKAKNDLEGLQNIQSNPKTNMGAYNLQILAEDMGEPKRSALTDLRIFLKPNTEFPIITKITSEYQRPKTDANSKAKTKTQPETQNQNFSTSEGFSLTLSESTSIGTLIAKIEAKTTASSKSGPIGTIRYGIAGGNILEAIRIDPITGEVYISKSGLDYETNPLYEVWLSAADSGSSEVSTVLKMVIEVTDSNDNVPIFDMARYNATVMEEEIPPVFVTKVSARDLDSGENGEVGYRILEGEEEFEIDEETGEIYTRTKLDREEIDSYELVVQAHDRGNPQLFGTSTVLVRVLDKNDNPPRFTRLFSVNVTENLEIGSFVIKITTRDRDIGPNANVSFSFVENPGEKFKIDPLSGNVTVSAPLDREFQEEYLLKVAAFDSAWRQETPLTITIQDLNDNTPEFEHSFYSFNFPELQRSTVFVGQVTATDRDKTGPNSIISYSLLHPSDLFTIDPATGEIFSKKTLKYKHSQMETSPENIYSLTVLATDNGKPPLSSECLVTVNVVDANNNPPKFIHKEYLSPVPFDDSPGLKILKLLAKDDKDYGINSEIEYNVVGGNGTDFFRVDPESGWIISKGISKKVGSFYILRVRASDKGVPPLSDEVFVTLIVTGENRNPPIFTSLSYQVIVPENEPIGSTILTVSASDLDSGPNGMIRYSISGGNHLRNFEVDPISGAVTILKPLDYDEIQEFHLNITAQDLGFVSRSASAVLNINLTDVNDNVPQFGKGKFEASILENSPIGTEVFRVEAFDGDSPKNAIIRYKIVGGSGRDLFRIDTESGRIESAVVFDFEEQNQYLLEITASNPDSNLFSSTEIEVKIKGVNEFYPKFVQSVFHFEISESSDVGTSVGTILASDQDSGEDGKVYYLFVGSSNDRGFSINPTSGIISVSRKLDRESQNRVILTVLAKNAGEIRGNDTDEAQVTISIQDGNDPPEFLESTYHASISEGSPPGTFVTTVQAVDKDVRPQNNQFTYSIIGGNLLEAFKIDPQTGTIETARSLDREKIPSYTLLIGGIDQGTPPQTGTTTVQISLLDLNDNGPDFDPPNLQGSIEENLPSGTSIMVLSATDPDLPPNGGPFSYKLVGGPHQDLVTISQTGVVRTKKALDRENTPLLNLLVEISDSGVPISMKSIRNLSIKVLDSNDSPSSPRNVQILASIDPKNPIGIPKGRIGNVKPVDPDLKGDYKCEVLGSSPEFYTQGCELYFKDIPLGPKVYHLQVSGNDGRHPNVISTVTIHYTPYRNATVENSIFIKVSNVSARNFLPNHFKNLQESLKSNLEGSDNRLEVFSMRDIEEGNLEIGVAVLANGKYRSPEQVLRVLNGSKGVLGVPYKVTIGYNPCRSTERCKNGGVCQERRNVLEEPMEINTENLVFLGPVLENGYSCKCMEGFIGKECEKRQDPCLPNPCKANGKCRKIGFDFQCVCPPNREGKYCDMEKGNRCLGNICQNGGSCRESQDGSSFFCLCRPGYRGNHCEILADTCRPNPCLNGGLCVPLKPGYQCSCTEGFYGRHCEKSTYGFNELSYMEFPPLDPTTNDISITFSTTKANSLLIYNYGIQSGGRSDFVAIELVNGKAVFSFGGTRTAITSISVKGKMETLADGSWHKITATRNGKVVSLSVSHCKENGDLCEDCRPGDISCYADDIGPTGTLNFNGEPLLIGGLKNADPILERPGQVHSDDFVGCAHSVSVNGRGLNLSNPLSSRGVLGTCNRKNSCSKRLETCGNFGICVDRWNKVYCQCGGELTAPNCQNALEPISLRGEGFVEFVVTEKHRRMQLLEEFYREPKSISTSSKSLSFVFRTLKANGLLFHASSNKQFTSINLHEGQLIYTSKLASLINITGPHSNLLDGNWHNLTLTSTSKALQILLDGQRLGEELDPFGVHDFLDPDLTSLYLGGSKSNNNFFEGCITNFSINNEIQPFNGSGSIFPMVEFHGKVSRDCLFPIGIAANVPDPLSIGITLVIVFFVVLLVAILVSFVVFRLRKQKKETKDSCHGNKQNGNANTILSGGGIGNTNENVISRLTSHEQTYHENGDVIRHLVAPELISKKIKERDLIPGEHRPAQRPDIIDREIISKGHAIHEHPTDISELPEHYDLENASSIAPSDIDIVYHYKGFREAAGVRKYKATPPPVTIYHHKHANQGQGHRHSQGFAPRAPPVGSNSSRGHQSTPLARLSPSSELSAQPRILTLHDISGKPLQSALLATTSSSGGVGKDALHSNSERSLNSPVMSQLSGQSSNSRKGSNPPNQIQSPGLTAEEIERLNSRPRTSSLVSTLDAVSSSSEAPVRNQGPHLGQIRSPHSPAPETHRTSSNTSTDESGNDSFTCSEIEYDNASLGGEKYKPPPSEPKPKQPLPPSSFDGFDSSFRGSLSTLVASDDELSVPIFRSSPNRAQPPPPGWDYLLNWGPNFESLVGVFKDIAELPDNINGRVPNSLRLPTAPKPSEEYV